MRIEIFTEDSGTTAEEASVEQVEDFFRGGFLPIKDLSTKLSSFGDVSIHIFSEEYGYIQGSDSTNELKHTNSDNSETAQQFSEALSNASQNADVIVILLTKPVFEEAVIEQWENLVSHTKSNTIWCIGASRSVFSSIDLQKLQSKVADVIVYQRVGVARISTEYKEELIATVDRVSNK